MGGKRRNAVAFADHAPRRETVIDTLPTGSGLLNSGGMAVDSQVARKGS